MMNFRSDKEAGAHPLIIAAVGRAFASGSPASFGEDEWTRRVERRLREVFDKPDLLAFPVITGTVANALSLACYTPPWGAVYCHPTAHIGVGEANAVQFYTSGAKLCLVDGPSGKTIPTISLKRIADCLDLAVALLDGTEHDMSGQCGISDTPVFSI
jgi:threonine aldolase